ncbi:RagB/SusD family nutrient uptake outer membrane protein [Compostibacter hankyongensis]|uniref:RagB/SusD family nutrient uptake outer membrane protein n=1 Tax=Compostibacter hankyongensis TaxID=1007089 RepID=A0ABP8FJU6_9BACT
MKISGNIQKNYPAVFMLIAVVTALAACKKGFLDRDPQGRYTSDTYPYPQGSSPFDQYVFAAYGALRSYNVSATPFIAAVSIRSDDADKGSTPGDGGADAQDMDNFPVSPSNGMANGLWTGYFDLINKCNIVMDQVANNEEITASDEIKRQSLAEARFIRAYGYFMLVRLFGRVPLIDTVTGTSANIPQSAPGVIYPFIEKDLQYAAANLPLSWDARFVGRATQGAANGLLAKVYLTEKKWGMAMDAADLVIQSGQYDLSTPYDRIFGEDGENTRESVFEIQATADATTPTDYGIQYASVQGVRGTGSWDLGWGWNTPSTRLLYAYEDGDPREARTVLFTSTPGHPGLTIYGEVTPLGLPNPRYNNKVYTNPAMRNEVGNRGGYWMNVRVLRYADVLLMYAEAANEAGNTAAALEKLEMVRARARGDDANILPEITTTDQHQLRQIIRHERRVELAMEHERFFDLVRWGVAADTLHAAGKNNFSGSRDNLLPVPQAQIDLSKGELTQNPETRTS